MILNNNSGASGEISDVTVMADSTNSSPHEIFMRTKSPKHKRKSIVKKTSLPAALPFRFPPWGITYGLPKIHKEGVPMRPILSSIGTCGYNIAKFLVPFLQPLTINECTVKDSFSFVDEISSLIINSHITMASFDIKSLFTNVPLGETISIVADALYLSASTHREMSVLQT